MCCREDESFVGEGEDCALSSWNGKYSRWIWHSSAFRVSAAFGGDWTYQADRSHRWIYLYFRIQRRRNRTNVRQAWALEDRKNTQIRRYYAARPEVNKSFIYRGRRILQYDQGLQNQVKKGRGESRFIGWIEAGMNAWMLVKWGTGYERLIRGGRPTLDPHLYKVLALDPHHMDL